MLRGKLFGLPLKGGVQGGLRFWLFECEITALKMVLWSNFSAKSGFHHRSGIEVAFNFSQFVFDFKTIRDEFDYCKKCFSIHPHA